MLCNEVDVPSEELEGSLLEVEVPDAADVGSEDVKGSMDEVLENVNPGCVVSD